MTESLELRDIQVLTGLEIELERFASQVKDSLVQAAFALQQEQAWLKERVMQCQREVEQAERQVEQARTDLRHCENSGTRNREGRYQPSNCRCEEAALRQAQQRLADRQESLCTARTWQAKVEQAAAAFNQEQARLLQLAEVHTSNALARLRVIGTHYEAVQVSEQITADLQSLKTIDPETHSRLAQETRPEIGQLTGTVRLMQIKGIRPDEWNTLDLDGRLDVLNQVEACIAKTLGRRTARIYGVNLKDKTTLGCFDGKNIIINLERVKNNDVWDALDTILHEGRHAYQKHAWKHKGFHPNDEEAHEWLVNNRHYLYREEFGYELYSRQIVEVDARRFAEDVLNDLYPLIVRAGQE